MATDTAKTNGAAAAAPPADDKATNGKHKAEGGDPRLMLLNLLVEPYEQPLTCLSSAAEPETAPSKKRLHVEAEKDAPDNVVETGRVYFMAKPRVGLTEVKSLDDVQRFFMVLSPGGDRATSPNRLVIIGAAAPDTLCVKAMHACTPCPESLSSQVTADLAVSVGTMGLITGASVF